MRTRPPKKYHKNIKQFSICESFPVSFGGIAGLFLGFSLLSGVELLYYFTLRACCSAARDGDMLRREQDERLRQPKPPHNLSLVPW